METTRAEYQAKMEEQLKQWGVRLEALQAKAESAGADLKKELLGERSELEKLQDEGKEHLATAKAAAAEAWDGAKVDLTDKWNHVSGAIDAIWARVK